MKTAVENNGNIFFTDKNLKSKQGYVVWLDMMGASSIMKRSLKMSMNFIARIHITALQCSEDIDVKLYPVMDGIYIFSEYEIKIKHFLRCFYRKIYDYFVYLNNNHNKKFLIRSSIAFGEIYEGVDINNDNSNVLSDNEYYKKSLLVGMPMIQSYETEKYAPPFGVYVHESARFAGDFPYTWFRWFDYKERKDIGKKIIDYFNWCRERPHMIEYPKSKIDEHKDLVMEYFTCKSPADTQDTKRTV